MPRPEGKVGGAGLGVWRRSRWAAQRRKAGSGGGSCDHAVITQTWEWRRSFSGCYKDAAQILQSRDIVNRKPEMVLVWAPRGGNCPQSGN